MRATTAWPLLGLALAVLPAAEGAAQADSIVTPYPPSLCPDCARWNAPAAPVRLYGNTWYVGTEGLSAILVTSPAGHILLDAGLPESAPLIIANIRSLGLAVEDIRLIVNSHAHYDHAGGIAALAQASGAAVAASPASAPVLESGRAGPDDPQYDLALAFPPVARARIIRDGDTLQVGPIGLTAHFTAGHTPGGTSWSWRSCEAGECLDFVYADSQTPVSAEGFLFTRSAAYPTALQDFEHGFAVLEHLPCDVLLTPHPEASAMWNRLAARERGDARALVDSAACQRYATAARDRLRRRVASETEVRSP